MKFLIYIVFLFKIDMASSQQHYTNYYQGYNFNKNTLNVFSLKSSSSPNYQLGRVENSTYNNSISTTSSGPYMTHSYYGNNGHIIGSCIG